ncbi:hypothetical protein KDU71_01490 [Carboxylicivirga sediminis]|uniref:Lipoprotein n=1 Tax=Carboxylicivirga sediminis TaxID=2006564 RepID=A0A941F0A9_9BACT|nr:hypothetical protein [Carboxylicivirga sediminis]MBR8534219.1 hypothetical protein [Carboxylicivirga sediminis]
MKKQQYIKHIVVAAMCFFTILQACKQSPSAASGSGSSNEAPGLCLADTIIYPVLIKNNDPYDTWTEQCLSRLERAKFVEQIFDAVYKHKAKAYSYNTHEELSISEVKDIEKQPDFSRDKVAKLQFWETWHFDEQQLIMTKKVQAILLAYEYLSEDGELRGYKAAFYIKLKE